MRLRTKKQQSELTKRRNTGLDDAASKDPGFSCQGHIGKFIGLYLRCELFATHLQHYYQTDKQYKKTRLNTNNLKQALEHFGLYIEKDRLLLLFQGGKGKRGKKSARQLRNGYLHRLSEADRAEIIDKHSTLVVEMKRLLKMRITNSTF